MSEQKDTSPLDLGLGALLNEVTGEAHVTSESSAPIQEPETPPAAPHEELTLYERLAEEKQWGELLKVTENDYDKSGDEGSSARLHWVLAHLEGGSLPAAFLAAPLESVATELSAYGTSAKSKALLHKLITTVAPRLEEGEVRNGLLAHIPKDVVVPQNARDTVGPDFPALDLNVSASRPVVEDLPRMQSKLAVRGQGILLPLGALILALLLATFGVFWLYKKSTGLLTQATPEVVALEDTAKTLDVPKLKLAGGMGTLDALYHDMESQEAEQKAAAQAQGTPNKVRPAGELTVIADKGAVAPPPAGVAPVIPGSNTTQPAAPSKKEQVDTTYPVEGSDIRDRERDQRRRDQGRDGDLGPGDVRPDIVDGYPVERYSGGKTYEVARRTSVLAEPSVYGRIIGRLESGDRVMVEGKLGQWLRLKSRKGRGGFVLAEDVLDGTQEDFRRDR